MFRLTSSCGVLLAATVLSSLNLNAQAPHFLSPVSYSVPGASVVAIADVNGDGFLDAVTGNGYALRGSGVSLLLGNGNGTFQPPQTLVSAGNPSYVLIGDFNKDGKMDIAVANEPDPNGPATTGGPDPNSVSILLGRGDGTFLPAINTPTLEALALTAADFNHDGKLDLAVATGASSAVQILLGNGNGTFRVSSLTVAGTDPMIARDFNKDGKIDLLAGGFELFGNGDGTFALGPALSNVPETVADVNKDSELDLVSVVAFGKPRQQAGEISLGVAPSGDWSGLPTVTTFSTDGNLLAADFNGDGKVDLFAPGSAQPWPSGELVGGLFLGAGDGTFTQAAVGFGFGFDTNGAGLPAFAALGDLDRNGSPDAVVANGTGLLVALNTYGHPPLLASVVVNGTFVRSGSTLSGTVWLGGPAPAGDAVIALSSSSTSAFVPASVTIPAGTRKVAFSVTTKAVTASTPVTITAAYQGVSQTANFTLVPHFTVSSVAASSLIGMYGGHAGSGTVTLSGPAADKTTVTLASANPDVLAVPANVAFPPGATTANFTVNAFHVASDTGVNVTATLGTVLKSATVTVKKETATVSITKAEFVVSKGQLTVQATSTDLVVPGSNQPPTLQVYNLGSGALVGNLIYGGANNGVGKFTAVLPATGPVTSIGVQSLAGGLATSTVVQK